MEIITTITVVGKLGSRAVQVGNLSVSSFTDQSDERSGGKMNRRIIQSDSPTREQKRWNELQNRVNLGV